MAWLADKQQSNTPAPAKQQTAPAPSNTTPMMAPDGSVRLVPDEQVQDYMQAGGKQVTKMLDPKGVSHWVPKDQGQDYQNAGGVDPDHPKIPQPQVNMRPRTLGETLGVVSEKEADAYPTSKWRIASDDDVNNAALMQKKPGTTGMTSGRLGIPVLNTDDYEYKPGVSQDTKDALRHSNNAQKSAANVMTKGTIAGLGALGGSTLFGPTTAATTGGIGFGGTAAGEVVGPSLARQGLQWVLQNPVKAMALAGVTASPVAAWKWLKK
jgi:hypothetical protein